MVCKDRKISPTWLLLGEGPKELRPHEVETHIDAYKMVMGDKGAARRIQSKIAESGEFLGEVIREAEEIFFQAGTTDNEDFVPYLKESLKTAIYRAKKAEQIIENIYSSDAGALENQDYVKIPRYEVAASAGGGAFVESEQIVDYLSFRSEWVRNTLGISVKDLALINVIGDSMEPTLSDGDVVLLDMTFRGVQDSSIYVLQLNGTLLVKRIQHKLNGSLVIKSDNKLYEPETVTGEEVNQLKIIGRVVWAGRKM